MKIKELPNSEKPYEKLEMFGEKVLSNSELLAIIIKNGTKNETAIEISQKILCMEENKNNSLRFLQDISIEKLKTIKGIGRVKAIQIKAIAEFAKRMSMPLDLNIVIRKPKDVADFLMEELRYERKEILKLIILNSKNVVQKVIDIGKGNNSSAVVETRNVFQEAIKMDMPKIILVHNHPSGDPKPSLNDINLTDSLMQISKLLGIQLLDHIIIGDGKYISIEKYKSEKNMQEKRKEY